MLTHEDKTVKNANEIFEACKDLPVKHWGFKDIGLPKEEMIRLVKNMKVSGKTTCLEVVSYDEQSCLQAAALAVECEFDYLMGTVFYPNVYNYIKKESIKYTPFCGKVSGSPSVLEGSLDEIIAEAKKIEAMGIDGFDLLAYRYVGNPEVLAERFVKAIKAPVCIAGSINSYQRLDFIAQINPWSFTMGSALFEGKFVPGGTFKENLIAVWEYMHS
jgi:hypothetical protein